MLRDPIIVSVGFDSSDRKSVDLLDIYWLDSVVCIRALTFLSLCHDKIQSYSV